MTSFRDLQISYDYAESPDDSAVCDGEGMIVCERCGGSGEDPRVRSLVGFDEYWGAHNCRDCSGDGGTPCAGCGECETAQASLFGGAS